MKQGGALEAAGPLGEGKGPAAPEQSLDDVRHVVDGHADLVGQQTERGHECDRDHGQDDAVLGHRLSLFAPEAEEEVEDAIHPAHLLGSRQISVVRFARWSESARPCSLDKQEIGNAT